MTQPSYPAFGGGAPSGPYGHPGYPTPSYPPVAGPSIPPNPHRPKRSVLPIVLAAVGGVVVLGAIGGGVAAYALRSKSVALPVEARMLPPQTSEVATQLIEATREPDEEVRRAYLAAELGAELCRPGAENPARRLEAIGAGSPRAAKELFFDDKKLEKMGELLSCGSLLGASLASPYQAVVAFEDGTKRQRVAVGHFNFTDLPETHGFEPQSFEGVPGFCRTAGEERPFGLAARSGPGCDAADYGAFRQETTWFLGTRAALDTMAVAVKRPKEELNTRLASLKEAAAQTDGLPIVRIEAEPKTSRDFFMSPCLFGASHSAAPFKEFLEGCFPKEGLARQIEEVDSKIKAAAYEMDADPQKAGAFVGSIVFVARDRDGAKDVERDVRDIVMDWKLHLELNDAALVVDSRANAFTTRQKKFAAIADVFFEALKTAKVSRKGRSIKIAFEKALSEGDKAALEDADRSTAEKRRAVAGILDALGAKKPIPEASLSTLVGPAWAHYLLDPAAKSAASSRRPMTADECLRVKGKVARYSLGDRAFAGSPAARSMLLEHKYATCFARPPMVDSAQRACLEDFRTPAEYAGCAPSAITSDDEPSESEFGDRAKR